MSRPLVLIVGMLSTKDAEGFLRNFAGLARALIAVPIGQDKGLPPDALAATARRVGITAQSAAERRGRARRWCARWSSSRRRGC